VLVNGNPGLANFLDGHDHPHVAVLHHMVRARTRGRNTFRQHWNRLGSADGVDEPEFGQAGLACG
jgi:hypothetical protein